MVMVWTFFLGYGLDSLFGTLALERSTLLWLAIGSRVASRIILSVKVKVLGGGFGLWLGDNIAILFMVKQEHILFLTVYGPTLSLDSLTVGR